MTDKPIRRERRAPGHAAGRGGVRRTGRGAPERYRPLPAGSHGLGPETVEGDQRQRLRGAIAELIAAKGYPAVRIADLARLAHVSRPTLYSLYSDKAQLLMDAYEDIARRTGEAIVAAALPHESFEDRLPAAMQAYAELAASEPHAVSLLVLGALGSGPEVRLRRRAMIDALEAFIQASRDPGAPRDDGDLTVRAVLGGIREITAARLRAGRQDELPHLVETLSGWFAGYPRRLPAGLAAPGPARGPDGPSGRDEPAGPGEGAAASERARLAEGRLPSGRSELPRSYIVNSQRERIVDAIASIVAEKGLAGLTIPEIARRANVSNQTFYAIYPSKDDAFLGAQKVGMHQALRVTAEAYRAHEEDWPEAVAAGIHALVDYLCSEPAHARLTLVDTFAASPRTIAAREAAMAAFSTYLLPGFERSPQLPAIAGEAVVGGIWQVLHHYIERDCHEELCAAAPQLVYFALTPFIGAEQASAIAQD